MLMLFFYRTCYSNDKVCNRPGMVAKGESEVDRTGDGKESAPVPFFQMVENF